MHAGGEEIRLWSLATACLITNDAGARADHRLPAVTLSALRVETSYSTCSPTMVDHGGLMRNLQAPCRKLPGIIAILLYSGACHCIAGW